MTKSLLIAVLALLVISVGCQDQEVDPDSSGATGGADSQDAETPAVRDFAPAYSPDGTRIAFYSYREEGDNGDVYVLDRETGNTFRVTSDSTFDIEPHWSPDGNQLAYTVSPDMHVLRTAFVDRNGAPTHDVINGGITTWSADGSTVAVNSRGEHGFVPELVSLKARKRVIVDAPKGVGVLGPWTGDMQAALYARTSGEESTVKDLYLFIMETGESILLTQGVNVQHRAWSSDYSRICLVGERGGQVDLFVVQATGGDLDQLTDTPEKEYMCSWSPDDRYIAYSKEVDDSVILHEFDLSTRMETRID